MTIGESVYRPHIARALERLAEAQRVLIDAETTLGIVNSIRNDIRLPRWVFPELHAAEAAVESARKAVAQRLTLGEVR